MPNDKTEIVKFQLPDGSIQPFEIPAGLSDDQARTFVLSKRPDLFKLTPEQQAPNATAQAHQQMASGQTTGLNKFDTFQNPGNSYVSMSPTGVATSPLIPAKTQASVIGAGLGGEALTGLKGAAQLPYYIRALATASGAGAGAGAGNLAATGNPKEALGTAAGTTAATMAVSPVAKFIQDLAGKAKAGPLFQAVNEAAGQNQVETSGMLQAAQDAQRLKQAGFGQMPQVISRFLARMNKGEPLTFEDARLIEQAAGGKLSQAEQANMRPQMYRQLSIFANEARKATMQAAGQSGAADTFAEALQKSRAGYQAQEKVDFTKEMMMELVKQYAKGGAFGAGSVGAGYGVYKAMGGGKK